MAPGTTSQTASMPSKKQETQGQSLPTAVTFGSSLPESESKPVRPVDYLSEEGTRQVISAILDEEVLAALPKKLVTFVKQEEKDAVTVKKLILDQAETIKQLKATVEEQVETIRQLETAGKKQAETIKRLETAVKKQLGEMAVFTFPSSVQAKLDRLMDRNNEGKLTPGEYEELGTLVDLNELVTLLKGQARLLLSLAPAAK